VSIWVQAKQRNEGGGPEGKNKAPGIWWHAPSPVESLVGLAR
jgi:hypothetical protein